MSYGSLSPLLRHALTLSSTRLLETSVRRDQVCAQALASAVLLRSTIHDATQSAPVELDVGLLPENHSQGVLIPNNRMSNNKKQTAKRGKRADTGNLQLSGGCLLYTSPSPRD